MAKLIHKPDGTITTDSGVPVIIVGKNDYTKDKQNGENNMTLQKTPYGNMAYIEDKGYYTPSGKPILVFGAENLKELELDENGKELQK